MNDLRRIVTLMLVEKKDILLSILLGFLAGIAAVGLFANSGYLISKAAITPPLYVLTISIAMLKFFSFTRALSRYGERFFSHRATFTILSNLRVHFFEKLEPLAPKIFQSYRSGDLLSRIVGDVESLQNFFLRVYYPPIVMVIVFLSTIFFTSFFSMAVAVVLMVGLLLTGFFIPLAFAWRQERLVIQLRERRAGLSTETTEFLYGFRDLKLHQKLSVKERELVEASNAYLKEQDKDSVQQLFSQSFNQLISLAVSWFILGMGAYFVAEGQLDGVFLAMLVMIALTVFENATPMAAFPSHFEDSKRASKRLFSVVDKDKKNRDPICQVPLKRLDPSSPLSIKMERVTFHYPDETRPTLKEVSLTIPAGTKTAIVGPSGSGKSTLLQLILKVYERVSGEIQLGNTPIEQLDEKSIWNCTNVILQSNHFFYGTIRENLQLARDGLLDEEMVIALSKVKLERFSLDDLVLEKGENLSGGEKQRLAIARALLKGSRLWLMDEPTSSVDSLTEQVIYNNLFHNDQGDTFILVSHRLTGLEKMDQIIVMEDGKIVESGTFDKLMEKKGYFYELKEIEASVF
ncbi:thiol reductant ABC exporter subunit CydC [Evansella tamaricis]|uniref:Thiol reductant ABC exporter subunit CydC n=1 Tax=Evansella tamaricis TaxID=2069301 RepID=A0ABS6JML2_9BACI|nr:thiol reductant ABC exporter subunit CydC [Evansella tamaricis]MBU9714600.1 thiol reductant ABC exporter subunit CydC [Evansella tamaricis]